MSSTAPDGAPGQNTSWSDGHGAGIAIPPAGWYPTPTGQQQYWDGEKWLALTPPDTAGSSASMSGSSWAPTNRRVVRWLVIVGGAVLLLGLLGGGIAWKVAADARQAEAAAEAAAEEAAAEAAAAEREEQEREEAAAAAAQARRDQAERDARRASVTEIEASVKKMAEAHAADGIIEGPIIEVSCSPVGGGSTDDLTEQTTVFECFAAHEDNGDGTMSGWTYNATMNWSSGSYTYGLGSP
jgi:Protein of unknown function (DUF2510)